MPEQESREQLFEQIAERIRNSPAAIPARHRELFPEHSQESPAAFLLRARLDQMARALRAGGKPSFAPALHRHFREQYGLPPEDFATLGPAFDLHLPPGYRREECLRFFGRDALGVSEQVEGNSIRKCALIGGQPAVIQLRLEDSLARCETDAADVYAAHAIAVRMLGLNSAATAFERAFARDALLGAVVRRQHGLRIPLAPDAWEALAWAICGQQISVAVAVTLRRELIRARGAVHRSGLIAHPTAAQTATLDPAELGRLKFSRSKAEYLLTAARAVASGEVPLNQMRQMSAPRAARMLQALRGIGDWTVQYLFLRGLGFPDCLPAGDVGLARGLEQLLGSRPSASEITELLAHCAPYRSYATYHVWSSLKGVGE